MEERANRISSQAVQREEEEEEEGTESRDSGGGGGRTHVTAISQSYQSPGRGSTHAHLKVIMLIAGLCQYS